MQKKYAADTNKVFKLEITHNNIPEALELLLSKLSVLEETLTYLSDEKKTKDELFTVNEACTFLRVSRATFYKLLKENPSISNMIGGRRVIKKNSLLNLM